MKIARKIDVDSAADRAAKAALKKLGIEVWVHGQVYGLRRDRQTPTGWRLVAQSSSVRGLLRLITAGREDS